MQIINNLSQANLALNKFISPPKRTRRYALDRMNTLMGILGNPQNRLKVIHIAGTSGKTSTSYYVASLLYESGYRVGLTVSPHVDEVSERAQIDLNPLPEKEYCKELGHFLDIVDGSGLNPSYFEVLIAFAYWLFEKRAVDYAVVETGLGGLLDATNVVDRADKVIGITDIGFDHTEILGDTIEEIAVQKAGIIMPGNFVFMNYQSDCVISVIKKKCSDTDASLEYLPDSFEELSLPLFQQRNFNLAKNIVDYVLDRDDNGKLKMDQVEKAAKTYIPARMEIVDYLDKKIILDGSHNEQKILMLVESVVKHFPGQTMTIMVSLGENKIISAPMIFKSLKSLGERIIITNFNLSQDEFRTSIDPRELAGCAKEAGFTDIVVQPDPYAAFEMLMNDKAKLGIVTGSFYLLNVIRPIIFRK